jgi:hypothetical protein
MTDAATKPTDEETKLTIGEVLHDLVDAVQGTGLDKEKAHAAIEETYNAPEVIDLGGNPHEGAAVHDKPIAPESVSSPETATAANPTGAATGTV